MIEKKFKKGEVIIAEGDTPTHFYIIQSGQVLMLNLRGEQRLEIDHLSIGHIIGESGVFGTPKSSYRFEALSEVKTIEIPIEPIKTVFEKMPQAYKVFVKALGDGLKNNRQTIKSLRQDQDTGPCPYRFIPRLTAILTLVAKNLGVKPKLDPNMPAYKLEEEKAKNPHFKETDLILSFTTLKIYTSRMFFESHQRMQSFCELLGKLGYLSLKYEKNEETELEELVEIRLHDVTTIEHFGEFYQHNFFKPGRAEIIFVDKVALQAAYAIVECSKIAEVDRNNIAKVEFQKLLKDIKEQFYLELKETHWLLLEKKGLFVKKQTINEVVYLSFDRYEFQQTVKYWQIIQEIDRWNEKGFVDLKTNYNEFKPHTVSGLCPQCKTEIKGSAKFCAECGHKLAA